MKPPSQAVLVVWNDAFDSENGWVDATTYKPVPCVAYTVGFLWEDVLPNHVSVTTSFIVENGVVDTVGMVTHIPKQMVLSLDVFDPPHALSQVSSSMRHSPPGR